MYRRFLFVSSVVYMAQASVLYAAAEPSSHQAPAASSTASAEDLVEKARRARVRSLLMTVIKDSAGYIPVDIQEQFPEAGIRGTINQSMVIRADAFIHQLHGLYNALALATPDYMHDSSLFTHYVLLTTAELGKKDQDKRVYKDWKTMAKELPDEFIPPFPDISKPENLKKLYEHDKEDIVTLSLKTLADVAAKVKSGGYSQEKSAPLDAAELTMLEQFTTKARKRLAINLFSDDQRTDYITVCAERKGDDSISVRVADTAFTLEHDAYSEERFRRFVVPAYQALTTPLGSWPDLFLGVPKIVHPEAVAGVSAVAPVESAQQPASQVAKAPVQDDKQTLQEAARMGNEGRISTLLEPKDGGYASQSKVILNTRDMQGHLALHEAILGDHAPLVRMLIQQGADTNMYDSSGRTPIHCVACVGNTSMAEFLLAHGACINAPKRPHCHLRRAMPKMLWGSGVDEDEDQTPLHIAALYGHVDMVNMLLAQHASLDYTDYCRRTPLHCAIFSGKAAIVKALLTKKPSLVDQADNVCNTPLHYAVQAGNIEIVRLLCSHGAAVNVKNGQGNQPLTIATMLKHRDIVEILLRHNANHQDGWRVIHTTIERGGDACTVIATLLLRGKVDIDSELNGQTPLACAVACDHEPMIRLLLSHNASLAKAGAPKAVPARRWISCPLHEAVDAGNLERVKLLCSQSGINIDETDGTGLAPIHIAAMKGYHSIVDTLCRKFLANVNKADAHGSSALHHAARQGHASTVNVLIEYGVDVNARDAQGYTPLHLAAEHGHTEVVMLLLDKGSGKSQQTADVHAVTAEDGYTPLHIAAKHGHDRIVALLLEKKPSGSHQAIDINAIAASDGYTPLHCAASAGHQTIAERLLQYGATKALPDKTQKTPLYCAAEAGHAAIVQSLFARGAETALPQGALQVPLAVAAHNRVIMQSILQHKVMTKTQDAMEKELKPIPQLPLIAARIFMDPEAIAERHSYPSLAYEEFVETELPYAKTVLHGIRRASLYPVLKQQRQNGEMTGYCGYYAFFHAKSLLTEADQLDRKLFVQDFTKALSAIKAAGGVPPYDYLAAQQIRHLIKSECPDLPIAVVGIDQLSALPVVADVPTALEINKVSGHLDLQHIDDFIYGKINEIAIIFGSQGAAGKHWTTVYVHRRSAQDPIDMHIADSIVGFWHKPLHNPFVIQILAPCYLMLTNPIQQWKTIFTQELLGVISPQYQAEKPLASIASALSVGHKELISKERVLVLTDIFLENVARLKSSMALLASLAREHRANNSIPFLFSVQLSDFAAIAEELRFGIGALSGVRDDDASRLLSRTIVEATPVLTGCINRLAETLQLTSMYEDVQDVLSELSREALFVRNQFREIVAAAEEREFYNATTLPLGKEKLDFILKYLSEDAVRLLGHLKEPRTIQTAVLLYGPPGNGKTTLAHAIAQFCGRDLYFVRTAGLGTKYKFSREEQLQSVEQYIKGHPHAVILFDEIDALVDQHESGDNAVQVLQGIMDRAAGLNFKDVIFLGTTNVDMRKEAGEGEKQLPPALKSRFGQNIIHIGNPCTEHRAAIIEHELEHLRTEGITSEVSAGQQAKLVSNTSTFSIRDLESIFKVVRQIMHTGDGYASLVEAGVRPALIVNPQQQQATVLTDAMLDRAYKSVYESIKTRWSIAGIAKKVLGVGNALLPYANFGLSVYQAVQGQRNAVASREQAERFHKDGRADAQAAANRGACSAGLNAFLTLGMSAAALACPALVPVMAVASGISNYYTLSDSAAGESTRTALKYAAAGVAQPLMPSKK